MGFNSGFKGLRKYCLSHNFNVCSVQCTYTGVPLATEPVISLIIVPLMRILQRNLKRTCLMV